MGQRSLGGGRVVARMVVMLALLLIGLLPAHAVVLPGGTTITTWAPIAVDDITIIVPTPFNPPGSPIFADFNGDGKVDLLVQALDASGTTYLFLADGNGKYTAISQSWKEGHLGLKWGADKNTIWAADYNGDGRADMILESKVVGGKNGLIYSGTGTTPFTTIAQTWDTLPPPPPAPSPGPTPATTVGATAGGFDVSQSGAASYSIPIVVPPGINGLVPNVSLNYNSQSGNGIAGVGWSLGGLSVIHRCPKTIAQDGTIAGIDFSANDKLCLDGQRLVPIGSINGGTEYRTEIESYNRVVAYGAAGDPSYFEVWGKDGKVVEYGRTTNSRIEAQGRTTAMLWAINKITDLKKNTITFSYAEDNAKGEFHLTQIDYGGSSNRNVKFLYETRTDITEAYQAGSKITTNQRLTNIQTFINSTQLVRNYKLGYGAAAPTSGRSRLSYLQECTPSSCLKPTNFDWSDTTASIRFDTALSMASGINSGISPIDQPQLGDFDGDGKMDIINFTQVYYYYSANVWTPRSGLSYLTYWGTGFGSASENIFADINGDGNTDIIRISSGRATTWLSTGGSFVLQDTSGSGLSLDEIKVGDFNGDGRADIAFMTRNSPTSANDTLSVWLSNGTGYSSVYWSTTVAPRSGLQVGDVTGDGRSDLVVTDYSSSTPSVTLYTAITNGFANYGKVITGHNTCATGCKPFYIGDMNGDGKGDIVELTNGNYYTWLWNGAVFVDQGSSGAAISAIPKLVDLNSDGRTDLLQIDSSGNAQARYSNGKGFYATTYNWGSGHISSEQVGDFNGDGRADTLYFSSGITIGRSIGSSKPYPDLLTTITNGLGAQTTVSYKPLTDATVYTKETSGTPGDTIGIQAAIYVVAGHSVTNGVGSTYSVTHKYTGLIAKLNGRGSLGFSSITHYDIAHGMQTATTYRQDFPYTGLPKETTVKVEGILVSKTSTLYAATTNSTGSDSVVRYTAPYADTVTDKKYEINSTVTASTATTTTVTKMTTPPNRYGSIKEITVTTTGDGKTYTKVVNNTYINESTTDPALSDWYKVAQVSSATATNSIQRQWGDAYPQGASSRKSSFSYYPDGLLWSETIEPDNAALKQITTHTYDSFGNRTGVAVSGAGLAAPRTSSTIYSPDGLFPLSSSNGLLHSETRTFDGRFGSVQKLTGPNGLSTTFYTDEFGRATGEVRADGTTSTVAYNFCAGCLANEAYSVTSSASGAPSSTAYFDKLGREIRRTAQGFSGATTTKQTVYNPKGQVNKISLPYYVNETAYWINYTYDALGRTLTETVPATVNVPARLTSTAYAPFKTTTTNGLNFSQVRLSNPLGQLISVQDVDPNAIAPATPPATVPVETRYDYDTFGNLRYVRDPNGNVTRTTFDVRGRKIAMDDPDMGHWEYEYNAVGELIKQWDAKTGRNTTVTPMLNSLATPTTTMEYDALGRLLKRTEAEGVSRWVYDSAPMSLGKLVTVYGPGGYARTQTYDSLGRPIGLNTTIGGDVFTQETGYDSLGRIETTRYPFTSPGVRLQVKNVYNSYGYLAEVRNSASNQLYWQANQQDAAGRLTQETLGNGLTTTHGYDAQFGYLLNIKTGVGAGSTSIQNLGYGYDVLGNLKSRSVGLPELNKSYSESFTYDAYNRLKTTAGTGGPVNKSYSYDLLGNITSKSDTAATYIYGDTQHLHAVTQLKNSAGTVIANYTYDANGNMISGNGRTTAHTSYNLPWNIVQGSNTVTFSYDADHQRMLQVSNDEVISYLSPRIDAGTHFEKVNHSSTGVIEYKHYINGGSGASAIYTVATNSVTPTLRYLHKDHLGSFESITNETGALVERLSYDPFGKRRNKDGTDGAVTAQSTDHGFTGHEMLDSVGLVHMNGRMYDPQLGRFIEADPTVQNPTNFQNLNRYSYVDNNPLSFTDPSGYKKFWKQEWFQTVVKVVVVAVVTYFTAGAATGALFSSTIAGTATSALTTTFVQGTWIAANIMGGAAAGFVAGGIMGGDMKSAATGAMSGGMTGGINGTYGNEWNMGRVAATSTAGGMSAEMQGGRFEKGFNTSFALSALTYANYSMRQSMIESSLRDPTAGNALGSSAGFFGDGYKLGGARAVWDDARKSYIFLDSPLGGFQGGPGKLMLYGNYQSGGVIDRVVEAYAGPHDFLNAGYWYDNMGNGKNLTGFANAFGEGLNALNVVVATPFAAAALVPTFAYGAIR